MAVFPERMDKLSANNLPDSFSKIQNYINYMGERIEFSFRNMTKTISAAGVSSAELYILVQTINQQLVALHSMVNSIAGNVTELQNSSSSVQENITEIQQNITVLQEAKESISDKIVVIDSDLDSLGERITALENERTGVM